MDAHDTGLTGIFEKSFGSTPIDWQGPDVAVISLGVETPALLNMQACEALRCADVVFGSTRQLASVATMTDHADCMTFPSPFSTFADLIAQHQSRRVVVLASGDSLFYGVGAWLIRLIGRDHLTFHASVSSIQVCFHAVGLPWQSAHIVSLHGRALPHLRRHLIHGRTLALFTDKTAHPAAIATELTTQGFGKSSMWVCEAMGTEQQSVTEWRADQLASHTDRFDALNVCIVRLIGRSNHLPAFPGIADEHFITGKAPGFGMISKREVRLAIVSLLEPSPAETAWDLGAGCGSVSIEWARFNEQGVIFAIEQDAKRSDYIHQNSERFGTVLNVNIVNGHAPSACDTLPDPNAVFIGGSDGNLTALLDYAWQRLQLGGKLVATAVTDQSREILDGFYQHRFAATTRAAEFSQTTISVTKNLPGKRESRTLAPVTLIRCIKT